MVSRARWEGVPLPPALRRRLPIAGGGMARPAQRARDVLHDAVVAHDVDGVRDALRAFPHAPPVVAAALVLAVVGAPPAPLPLVAHVADRVDPTALGGLPLCAAIAQRNLPAASLLWERGGEVAGASPVWEHVLPLLFHAAEHTETEGWEALAWTVVHALGRGAPSAAAACVSAAAQGGWLAGVRRLVTDPPPGLDQAPQAKDVALLAACHHGHLPVVAWLLTPAQEGGGGLPVAHANWHALRTAADANQGPLVTYLVQRQQEEAAEGEGGGDAWTRALEDAVRLAVKKDAVDAVDVLVPAHRPLSLELLCNAVADRAHRVLAWMFERAETRGRLHQLLELEPGRAGRLSLPFTIALINARAPAAPPLRLPALDLLWTHCVLPFGVADVDVVPQTSGVPEAGAPPSGTFRTLPLYTGIFNTSLPLVRWACETAGADPCGGCGTLFASALQHASEPIVWYLWDRMLHPVSPTGTPLPSRLTTDRAQDGVDGRVSYERFVAWAVHHGRHAMALYLLGHPPPPPPSPP